jgi:ABC-type antimicrobial peptide transport system permease subunit
LASTGFFSSLTSLVFLVCSGFYSLASCFAAFPLGVGFGVSCLAGADSSFLWFFFPFPFLTSLSAWALA